MIPDLCTLKLGSFIKSEVKLLNSYIHIMHDVGAFRSNAHSHRLMAGETENDSQLTRVLKKVGIGDVF